MKSKIFNVAVVVVIAVFVFVQTMNVVSSELYTSFSLAMAFFVLGMLTNSRPRMLRVPVLVISLVLMLLAGYVFRQWPDTDNAFVYLPWALGFFAPTLATIKYNLFDAKAESTTTESE